MKDIGIGRLCVCVCSLSLSLSSSFSLFLSLFFCVCCVFKPKDNLRYYSLGNHLSFLLFYVYEYLPLYIYTDHECFCGRQKRGSDILELVLWMSFELLCCY